MKANSKNPLFVVTNKGQDVEQASGLMDALIKKLGLEPVIEFLEGILDLVLAQVQSYAAFEVAKQFLDEFVDLLEKILKVIDPVLAFSVIKR